MAHDIYKNRAMVFAGEVPWHGLGTRIPANGTWDEIAPIVGFYEVEERELYAPGRQQPIPDKKALFRADNGGYLSTVGSDYGVVQFREMAAAVQEACGEEAVFHTAGLLGSNGVRGWLMGELTGEPLRVVGDKSEIRKYVLVTSSHSGWNKLVFKNVATRVVCANTVAAALSEKEGFEAAVRHTSRASERLASAARAFKAVRGSYERFGELANIMATTAFPTALYRESVDKILPLHDDKKNSRREIARTVVLDLERKAVGLDGIRGTAWGAYQGWTEYADHHQTYRALPERSAEASRLESLWLGRATELKREALFVTCELAGIDAAKVLATA